MRGINVWCGGGNVSGPIKFAMTNAGDPACSFMLVVDKGSAVTTWVRVNVYGTLVRVCEQRLKKGSYLFVKGELMNRERATRGDEEFPQRLTEIRAEDLVFVNTQNTY